MDREPGPQDWAAHVTFDSGRLIQWAYKTPDHPAKSAMLREVADALEEATACLRELATGGHRGALLDRLGVALKLRERNIPFEDFRRKIEGEG